jgi:TRAP-type uncharacterized transport system fused permease subunit
VAAATLTATLGIVTLAGAFGGWITGPLNRPERLGLGVAGGLFLYGDLMSGLAGGGLAAMVLVLHIWRHPPTVGLKAR